MTMTDMLRQDIKDCEMLLIGIGGEWKRGPGSCPDGKPDKITDVYNRLSSLIAGKNYFIVTSCEDGAVYNSCLNPKRITAPFFDRDEGEEQWNFYNRWLSMTLNRKLLLLELGEGFESPGFIRWPFENITFINNKAKLYRIHAKLSNIPENIRDKSVAVKENSLEYIVKMLENCD